MSESRAAVYGAIAANVAIAVTKFVVAGVTGSSAMLSEAVHSTVDTGDGVLLLVGLHLSQRPATREHPFGHGKELYFWSLIVAVLIFALGGGISLYEGVQHVLDPVPLEDPTWNYAVLAAAALFEGSSLAFALHQFTKSKGSRPFWRSLHTSKDPSAYTVIAEDSAALLGLAFAAAGIWGSHALDMPVLDGVASIAIGLLLAAVAIVLVHESRGLLVGEGVSRETAEDICRIAESHSTVVDALFPLTMYMGPDEVLLTMDVVFEPTTSALQITETIRSIEHAIAARYPKIRRIYIEARDPGKDELPAPNAQAPA